MLALLDGARTVALLGALAGVGAAIGYLALGLGGVLLAVASIAVMSAAGLGVSPAWVIRMQGGRPLSSWDAPEIASTVARLAGRAGIAVPRLFWLPTAVPNAMAVGGSRDEPGALAITAGAVRSLTQGELEGVLAHEMAHLKNNDTHTLRLAGLVSLSVTTLVRAAAWMALLAALFVGAHTGRLLLLAGIAFFAPVVLGYFQAAISRTRELAADTTAATLTGRPQALASALAKIQRLESGWQRWLGIRPQQSFLRSHPATRERIKRLVEMSPPAPEHTPPERTVLQPTAILRSPGRRTTANVPIRVIRFSRGF